MVPYNFGEIMASSFHTARQNALQRKFAAEQEEKAAADRWKMLSSGWQHEINLENIRNRFNIENREDVQLENRLTQAREHGFLGTEAELDRLFRTREREATQDFTQDRDWSLHHYGLEHLGAQLTHDALQRELDRTANRSGLFITPEGRYTYRDAATINGEDLVEANPFGLNVLGLRGAEASPPRPEDVDWSNILANGPDRTLASLARLYQGLTGNTPVERERRYQQRWGLYETDKALNFGGRVRRHFFGDYSTSQPYSHMQGIGD